MTSGVDPAPKVGGNGPLTPAWISETNRVHAVVLAGVHTWDDSCLDRVVCRPLLPVAGRPLIWHVLDWFRREGVRQASVCGNSDTKYLRHSLRNGDGLSVRLEYFEDTTPRGPAGCVRDATVGHSADAYVIVEGTIVPDFDLKSLIATHLDSEADLTVVTLTGPSPQRNGDVSLRPAGVYVFSQSALRSVPETGYQDIKERLIPTLYGSGCRIVTYALPAASVLQVHNEASYLAVNMYVIERLARLQAASGGLGCAGEGWPHLSVRKSQTARIIGPVLVGADCVIESDALILGPTVLGRGSLIERGAVVCRSVIWERCSVGQVAQVDRSVLTDGACVAAGEILCGSVRVGAGESRRGSIVELARRFWFGVRRACNGSSNGNVHDSRTDGSREPAGSARSCTMSVQEVAGCRPTKEAPYLVRKAL